MGGGIGGVPLDSHEKNKGPEKMTISWGESLKASLPRGAGDGWKTKAAASEFSGKAQIRNLPGAMSVC